MNEEDLSRLRMMIEPRHMTWELSLKDITAIKFAVDRIADLERENAGLREACEAALELPGLVRLSMCSYNDLKTNLEVRDRLHLIIANLTALTPKAP